MNTFFYFREGAGLGKDEQGISTVGMISFYPDLLFLLGNHT